MTIKLAKRSDLPPFIVMNVMSSAEALEAEGANVMHLEIGQPSTGASAPAKKAIVEALEDPASHAYTMTVGINPLREGIAGHYSRIYGLSVNPDNVVVSVGSSLGFAMVFLTCFDPGDTIAITNPGYSAYRNLMEAVGLRAMMIGLRGAEGWKLKPEHLDALPEIPTGLIISSPANPTGVVLNAEELAAITAWCEKNDVRLISDEVYHGISFGVDTPTALSTAKDAIIINSFSKYFSMTGHRVGWMIVPDDLVDPMDKLAQNAVISVPTLSQIAATAAICDPASIAELESHITRYGHNLDILRNGLDPRLMQDVAPAEGAFYLYVRTTLIAEDSAVLADRLLQEAHVATTTGVDFDTEQGRDYLRLSFAGSTADMKEAVRRINTWIENNC
jgi:aspartate/methionine/tyrosine aminotransferase